MKPATHDNKSQRNLIPVNFDCNTKLEAARLPIPGATKFI
jgi:hypothetical protein